MNETRLALEASAAGVKLERDAFASPTVGGGASAVKEPSGNFEARKSSRQVRSPGVPDAAKGSPVLNDLTDLHCTCCTGCVTKSEKVN